ncbi:MAG: tRNA (adenosine(37)-N6)-threonylcarbamoyltransferase complex ATPase subunit type 1 TsaE [Bacteroidota bacterium]|nr:tRNA (adenosine(37)-N6)-threonylcarbamoyltransferase complex ATPase subunit type 1 TsaE [Bacteroidota bacterium]
MQKFVTHSEEETVQAGNEFSKRLTAGNVVALYGDLGSGKTRFVKGISRGFGIHEHVTSPTFVVVNEHLDGRLPLYHFDFYRLKSMKELDEIGFEEYIFGTGVCVLEWAEMIQQKLPVKRFDVFLDLGMTENDRIIRIEEKK